MASFHFAASVPAGGALSRAGYCAGKKLNQSGFVSSKPTRDHSKREDVRSTELLFPEGCEDFFGDKHGKIEDRLERVWGAVEEREKWNPTHPRNPQYVREYVLALPRELNAEQQHTLLRAWAEEELAKQGMVVQMSIHEGKNADGVTVNPHAHLLVTMRSIAYQVIEKQKGWDCKYSATQHFGLKNEAWNKTDFIKHLRASWAHLQNQALSAAGCEARVSAASNKDRGLPYQTGKHIGKAAAEIHARGEFSFSVFNNQQIKLANERYKEQLRKENAVLLFDSDLSNFFAPGREVVLSPGALELRDKMARFSIRNQKYYVAREKLPKDACLLGCRVCIKSTNNGKTPSLSLVPSRSATCCHKAEAANAELAHTYIR